MNSQGDDAPILLNREQVGRMLGISQSHVKRLDARGVLTAIRLGATVKYRKADILEAIDRLAEDAKRKAGE
jgi:hypothetical protein